MRISLLQLCASDDPAANLNALLPMLEGARKAGAEMVFTPEVTNCVSTSRTHQQAVLAHEAEDQTLKALQKAAQGLWLSIGSLALKTDDPDGRFANRSFLLNESDEIVARYDKIHMFDVEVSPEETYRESDGYRPGREAVLADTPWAKLGLTICYDLRFPHLYRKLAKSGAEIIAVPAAFSPVTGKDHWEPLLRARAIETGCFIVAAAQTGEHSLTRGKPRRTYGHSMVVSPWGEVLLDAGAEPGVYTLDVDLSAVAEARRKIPSLSAEQAFEGPYHG